MGDRSHGALCPGPAPVPKLTNSHMMGPPSPHTHSLRGPKATTRCPRRASRVNSGPFSPAPSSPRWWPFLGCVTRCHHKSFWGSVLAAGDLPGQSVFASCGHFTHAVHGPFSKYSHTGTHLVHEQRDLGRSSHKMLFFILVTDFPWKCVPRVSSRGQPHALPPRDQVTPRSCRLGPPSLGSALQGTLTCAFPWADIQVPAPVHGLSLCPL